MNRHNEIVLHCLNYVLETMIAAENELGNLDAVAGDGDHGAGMVRGFRAAVATSRDAATVRDTLQSAGAGFSDSAGGASGALVGTLISTIGQNLPDGKITATALYEALQ